MARAVPLLHAFNRGCVSPLALARTDVDRIRLSAEMQTNWLPRKLGPMMLRPGTAVVGETNNDFRSRIIPFVFSASDTALLDFSPDVLRFWINDVQVSRPTVTTVFKGFGTPASWTLANATGAGAATFSGTTLHLTGAAQGGWATASQSFAIPTADRAVEHALRIVISRGPVTLQIGTAAGLDDIVRVTSLDTGTHSIAFTPAAGTATVFLQFRSNALTARILTSCELEAGGGFFLPTPWGASKLDSIRVAQSADVIFVACEGIQQRRIERRSAHGWSIVTYEASDGPFGSFSTDTAIRLTPSDIRGDITVAADLPVFRPDQVGCLLRLFHNGQIVNDNLATSDVYSNSIRISGVSESTDSAGVVTATTDRSFGVTITGTWVGTLSLQRSFDGPDSGFTDFKTYTVNSAVTIADNLNNVIVWYRIGFKAANYTSGMAIVSLNYAGGGGAGICRITTYTSSISVGAEVLTDFLAATATSDWREGQWSDLRGWPTAVALHEGRIWWAGNDRIWGSVSDDYNSFDIETVGDAGPINRSIGEGPIATVHWLLPLTRLVVGTDAAEIPARSSSFDEPLTPTNFTIKAASNQGSAQLPAVRSDGRAVFVQRSGQRLYELAFDVSGGDYRPRDLTRLNPEMISGVVGIAIQRQPDTRIHVVCGDGTVAVLLYDPDDEAEAWWRFETDGLVEDVAVLPGTTEDAVYYIVNRTIGGVENRYIERHAMISECLGGTITKCVDSHVVYSGNATTTMTSLNHLEGKTVEVWADGLDVGSHVVSGGSITLTTAAQHICAGLGYTAQYKSTKLAYAAQGGTALTQRKRLDHLGLILASTHAQGLKYGRDFDNLDNLPQIVDEETVDPDSIWDEYDHDMMSIDSNWDTDARLCLQAASPRPCTVVGAIISLDTSER